MGISGLIPILKSIHAKVHIREYSGQSIAVDGYVWLHRGVFSCAMELAMGKPTDKYVQYFMHYVRMLKFHKIDPVIVFDGGRLPSKRHTEEDRHTKREEYRAKGMEYLRTGERKKAFECFQKCVDVTPEMAYQVIKQLKNEKVKYVVAPYEADAQLAYLMKSGKITAVITEDSDLIVFGCKTIIFKLDKFGEGIEISLDRLSSVSDINLKGWTTSDIRQMCILSGCDYLPSLSGMGLKTAHKLLQKYKTADKVIQFIRFEGKIPVPADYELDFNRAEFTFLYQRVYDMDTGEIVYLTPLPESLDTSDMSFLGEKLDKDTATKVAQGILHPCTRKPIIDIQHNSRYDNKENIPVRLWYFVLNYTL
ncbi:PIN domain-like protein [Umbelopsis sp. PMI_123]|nr:PIN domain-like protein [Umbelopsis sp. PMI_123]